MRSYYLTLENECWYIRDWNDDVIASFDDLEAASEYLFNLHMNDY